MRNISSMVWLSSQGSALFGGINKSQVPALFRNVDFILLCHIESLELLLCQNTLFRCVVVTWLVQRDTMWAGGGQRNKEENHCFPYRSKEKGTEMRPSVTVRQEGPACRGHQWPRTVLPGVGGKRASHTQRNQQRLGSEDVKEHCYPHLCPVIVWLGLEVTRNPTISIRFSTEISTWNFCRLFPKQLKTGLCRTEEYPGQNIKEIIFQLLG